MLLSLTSLLWGCADAPPVQTLAPSPSTSELVAPVAGLPRRGAATPAWRAPTDRPSVTVYATWTPFSAPLAEVPFDQLTRLAITGAVLESDGRVTNTSRWGDNIAEAASLASPHGVRVHLGVRTRDTASTSALLASPSARAAATAALAAAAASGHGVLLDVQGLALADKAAYVAFVAEVRAAVGEVVLAMPAVDATGAYDFDQLAFASDGLLLRGFDYRGIADAPGPISPLDPSAPWGPYALSWTITDYRTWGAPDASLVLGLPLFGIEWPTTNDTVPGVATGDGVTLTWAAARDLPGERRYDAASATPYALPDATHQLWSEDTSSLAAKAALGVDEGLAGIGLWGITYDGGDPDLWRALDDLTHRDGLRLARPSPGDAGGDNRFRVTGADPGDRIHVVVGTREGSTGIPGCPNAVPMTGLRVLGSATADGTGTAEVTAFVPAAAAGRRGLVQAVRRADCHVSQVVSHVFTDPGASPCGPHAVLVDDTFCIDRYEGALEEWNGAAWVPADPWLTVDGRQVRAVPAAGIQPQSYISADEAQAACAASGKRLCTSTEWLAACRGPYNDLYPYGPTHIDGACNDTYAGTHPVVDYFGTSEGVWDPVHMNDPGIVQQPGTVAPGGAFGACESHDGAFDMHGNVHEWVADAGGTFRGGFFADAAINGLGCTYTTTAHSRGYHDYSTGFRCCADAP